MNAKNTTKAAEAELSAPKPLDSHKKKPDDIIKVILSLLPAGCSNINQLSAPQCCLKTENHA